MRRIKLDNTIWGLRKREKQRRLAARLSRGANCKLLYPDDEDRINTEAAAP